MDFRQYTERNRLARISRRREGMRDAFNPDTVYIVWGKGKYKGGGQF